jgi:hypothetical protein
MFPPLSENDPEFREFFGNKPTQLRWALQERRLERDEIRLNRKGIPKSGEE